MIGGSAGSKQTILVTSACCVQTALTLSMFFCKWNIPSFLITTVNLITIKGSCFGYKVPPALLVVPKSDKELIDEIVHDEGPNSEERAKAWRFLSKIFDLISFIVFTVIIIITLFLTIIRLEITYDNAPPC